MDPKRHFSPTRNEQSHRAFSKIWYIPALSSIVKYEKYLSDPKNDSHDSKHPIQTNHINKPYFQMINNFLAGNFFINNPFLESYLYSPSKILHLFVYQRLGRAKTRCLVVCVWSNTKHSLVADRKTTKKHEENCVHFAKFLLSKLGPGGKTCC